MPHPHMTTKAGTLWLAGAKEEARGETRKSARYLFHFHFEDTTTAETWLESQLPHLT